MLLNPCSAFGGNHKPVSVAALVRMPQRVSANKRALQCQASVHTSDHAIAVTDAYKVVCESAPVLSMCTLVVVLYS